MFREEVGLKLDRVRFSLLQEAVDDPQFHQSAHFLLINYFAHSRGSVITPNQEIEESAWVTPEQALTYSAQQLHPHPCAVLHQWRARRGPRRRRPWCRAGPMSAISPRRPPA